MDDRSLSNKEISDYLGVTHETVNEWGEEHEMFEHRIGKFWKIKKINVDNWVKSNMVADLERGN